MLIHKILRKKKLKTRFTSKYLTYLNFNVFKSVFSMLKAQVFIVQNKIYHK